MSISSIILDNMENIVTELHTSSEVFTKIIPPLREQLLAEGKIVAFEAIPYFDGTLTAIDGGRASEDLSGGDLMVVGAGVGEGHSTNALYANDDAPTEAWGRVLPHKTNNKDIVADVMYAMELRVLNKVTSDMKIIDGAYLGNVSHLLFALAGSNYVDSERIDTWFEAIDCDADGVLRAAFAEVLRPPVNNSSTIVSLPKSDSAQVYSKEFLGVNSTLANSISDRILASRLLHPGEMLFPRNIASNPQLITKLSRLDVTKYDGKYPELYKELIKDKIEDLHRLDNESSEVGLLWTTYFKPYEFSAQSKALKIEFPYHRNNKTNLVGALAHAQKLIGIIDSDVIDGYILEPWCQYMADVQAKDVSSAITLVKNTLIASVDNSYELAGLLRGYRT